MKVRTVNACITAALFISFSTSTVLADVSLVPTRGALNGTDTINWEGQGEGDAGEPDYFSYLIDANFGTDPNLNLPNVMSDNGMMIAVSQDVQHFSSILREPSPYFRSPTNLPENDYLLSTQIQTQTSTVNHFTFTFSDDNGPDICGFGTQSAPGDLGVFTAQLEAFNGTVSSGAVQVIGTHETAAAPFIGISSTTPMTSVKFSIENSGNGGGSFLSSFVINEVTLTACEEPPEIPVISCNGFAAPMANHPVKAKKNRAFPLKIELFDADGFEQTDIELVAAPVVTVMFASSEGGDAVDVSDDALKSSQGSDGNLFEYTDDGIWQFNLKSKGYASGTYYVTVDSGDPLEYVIAEPSCVTSFSIK